MSFTEISQNFDLSYQDRKEFLKAPSTFSLCKTIILQNSKYDEKYCGDELYPRHVIVITQFEDKMSS